MSVLEKNMEMELVEDTMKDNRLEKDMELLEKLKERKKEMKRLKTPTTKDIEKDIRKVAQRIRYHNNRDVIRERRSIQYMRKNPTRFMKRMESYLKAKKEEIF